MKQHKHPVHPIYKNKTTLAVYLTLRALIIFILVRAVLRREYESVFLCALSLVLMLMPSILSKKLKIVLPDALEIIILLFIFAAEILGELNSFYVRVPNWDTMLHTINGFLCAAIGFSLVLGYTLLKSSGCAKIANLASNVASMVIFFLDGDLLFSVGIPAMLCSMAGNYVGARFAIKGGSDKIRSVMFLVLGLLFVKVGLNLLGIIDF